MSESLFIVSPAHKADSSQLTASKLTADRSKLTADHSKLTADRSKLKADRSKLKADCPNPTPHNVQEPSPSPATMPTRPISDIHDTFHSIIPACRTL